MFKNYCVQNHELYNFNQEGQNPRHVKLKNQFHMSGVLTLLTEVVELVILNTLIFEVLFEVYFSGLEVP